MLGKRCCARRFLQKFTRQAVLHCSLFVINQEPPSMSIFYPTSFTKILVASTSSSTCRKTFNMPLWPIPNSQCREMKFLRHALSREFRKRCLLKKDMCEVVRDETYNSRLCRTAAEKSGAVQLGSVSKRPRLYVGAFARTWNCNPNTL
jgi:hypothetical protein